MRKKPSTMDLSKGAFIAYGMARDCGGEQEGERGDKNFVTIFSWRSERGAGKRIFFSALFLWGFFVKETLYVLELRHIKACF